MKRREKETPVYRLSPLPQGALRGRFIVAANVTESTYHVLSDYGKLGRRGHEGIVFWAGRELGDVTVFTSAVAPKARSGPQRVMVDATDVGNSAIAARRHALAVLAQVHSHPGDDARHSDGDDSLIIQPFEGKLSIVIPRYGAGAPRLETWCIHQFQDGRWVLCDPESVRGGLVVAPSLLDLRHA
jgi:hypothetical protein